MAGIPTREVLEERLGETLGGRFRLVGVLGAGGQGGVYRAVDMQSPDDVEVAIKVLHAEQVKDPVAQERLRREAQALKALEGTAALAVRDEAFTADGHLALVTELLVGEELEDRLLRFDKTGERIPIPDILKMFDPIAATLAKAHSLDIVHRDLKPGNVFLCEDGGPENVRLLDFGFAKFARLSGLTVEGFVAGSPSYLSPEAWQGKPVTPSMDVYGFAAMLYKCITGRTPFTGKTPIEMYRQVLNGPRPKVSEFRPDLPPELDQWAEMALAKDPADRFFTAQACLNALHGTLELAGAIT